MEKDKIFCVINWEHVHLGGGLKEMGEACWGAWKNVKIHKIQFKKRKVKPPQYDLLYNS